MATTKRDAPTKAKMILSLACGHTLHLAGRTTAKHQYNRANCTVGRSAACHECETMQGIVESREEVPPGPTPERLRRAAPQMYAALLELLDEPYAGDRDCECGEFFDSGDTSCRHTRARDTLRAVRGEE